MSSYEKFNLNWNEFGSCTVDTFKELLSDQDFTDVTLACDDDKHLKAHKAILSSCSPFFKKILKKNPHQHPLVYLKGVDYSSLQSIIQFIYLGQTEVGQEDLEPFLAAAKDLEIRGLNETRSTNDFTQIENERLHNEMSNRSSRVVFQDLLKYKTLHKK